MRQSVIVGIAMTHADFIADTGIARQRHTLADGRDLIYFDDPDTKLPKHRAPDLRELDPRPVTARMRQDPLSAEWVSIAAARQNRVFLPPANLDPLRRIRPRCPALTTWPSSRTRHRLSARY